MRLMQYRALREVRASSEMLMYNQAIDICTSEKLEVKDYRRALQVVNVTSRGDKDVLLMKVRRAAPPRCARQPTLSVSVL